MNPNARTALEAARAQKAAYAESAIQVGGNVRFRRMDELNWVIESRTRSDAPWHVESYHGSLAEAATGLLRRKPHLLWAATPGSLKDVITAIKQAEQAILEALREH